MVKYNTLIFSALLFGTINAMEEKQQKKVSPIQNAAIGIVAAGAEIAIDQPLIYFKNMMQSKRPINWKMPAAWYRGAGAGIASLAPTTAIQVAVNGMLNDKADNNSSTLRQMMNAWCAGAMSAVVSSPSEALIFHQQAGGKNAFQTMKHLWQEHGTRCLYRGMLATAIRDGGFACGFLALGPAAKEYLKKYTDNQAVGMFGLVGAGLLAATGTHIFDFLKTIMQKDFSSNRRMTRIMLDTIATEGHAGLFKGFLARTTRIASAIILMSTVAEQLQKHITKS